MTSLQKENLLSPSLFLDISDIIKPAKQTLCLAMIVKNDPPKKHKIKPIKQGINNSGLYGSKDFQNFNDFSYKSRIKGDSFSNKLNNSIKKGTAFFI